VRKAEDMLKGKSSHGTMEMKVTTEDFSRTLKMESWWVGTEKALITILAPKQEAGNRTLKIGRELWMYLRTTETSIKVPPSMMLQSWMGSDYTYDDLVRESDLFRDYHITLVGNESVGNEECWKMQLIPKPNAPVTWGKQFYWVRKSDNLPARVEYFDEKGKSVRLMLFEDFKIMGGRKIPTRWLVKSMVELDRSTEIKIENLEFDVKIPDRIFTFRGLER
jgi:outer membrane lipoprotein-sorting protein